MNNRDHGEPQEKVYQEQGYLHLPQYLSQFSLDALQSSLEVWVEQQIASWRSAGLLTTNLLGYDFNTRLYRAWTAAKTPKLITTDIKEDICSRTISAFGVQRNLLELAKKLLGVRSITLDENSFFRAKLPEQDYTSIPWHQDAQCISALVHHQDFLTLWIPLVEIGEWNSCLEIATILPDQGMYESCIPSGALYVGMRECDVGELVNIKKITMQRGDILCMHKFLPHRSLDNSTNKIRWSVELRYTQG